MDRFESLFYVERRPTGSERGFYRALDLAERNEASLTLGGVLDERGRVAIPNPWVPGAGLSAEALRKRWRGRLLRFADIAAEREVEVRVRLFRGRSIEVVRRELERQGHDLVLAVAHAATSGLPLPWPLDEDRELVRHCPTPVWLLHPAQGGEIRRVLAAVDVSGAHPEALNRKIVALAGSLAHRHGAWLHVVHAWSILGEFLAPDSPGAEGRRRASRRRRDLLNDRSRELRRLVELEAPARAVTVTLRKGSAGRTIRAEVLRSGADVVVAGSGGRDGIGAVLFPSLPERLVGRVPASVLTVKLPASANPRAGEAPPDVERTGAAAEIGS